MRGTLLNTATVVGGSLIGLAAGRLIPEQYQQVGLSGLGLITAALGVRMFFKSQNPLVPAIAIVLGGVAGLALGIHQGIDGFATWARNLLGGELGRFNEALVTSFVLYCVGPMTLLGCLEDGLQGKTDLLKIKSTMDGFASIFLAAAFGVGVLVCALPLLLFQGALTLGAKRLAPLAQRPYLLDEVSATGGAILLGIGIGLLDLKNLQTANYLPALLFAIPLAALLRKLEAKPQEVAA